MGRRLQNDLRVLSFPTANPPSTSHLALAEGNQLGIAYVIRGSRLGATVLRPRIPSDFSASYFDFVLALSRVQFLAQLQSVSNSPDAQVSDAAIQGAKVTFGLFARLLTKPRDSAPV
jgi:heme oxygenase